ncbi:MAG: LacI family DNA-binding transcriptional regulator [Ileibacterium sp.]|nr:LacI family DNA-binding transcriptional regulator [Ileibacterium sp.]
MGRITIKDIARESGYSIGTVSRALNRTAGVSEEAREAIFNVVAKYNFQLNPNAKFLKQRAKEGIAILIRGTENMLFSDLTEKIQKKIESLGYDAIVYYIGEEENEVQEAIHICTQRSLLGIMFLGSTRENFRRYFRNIRIPSLLVTNSAVGLPYPNLSSVTTNDAQGAQFAIEYLFSLNHTHIGVLGGRLEDSQAAKSRYQGIQYAYYNRGKNFDFSSQYETEYFTIEGGYSAMNRLLDKFPEATAVFVMSDVMAIGAMRAAADRGLRIPEDLSIIGFDGLKIADYIIPRLTTIKQDTTAIAERSVSILTGTIEEQKPAAYEEIAFSLVEGESVRALEPSQTS